MSDETKPVYSFGKNAFERVDAKLTEFHGRRLADLRIFHQMNSGEWKPTKKGVCVAAALLPELRRAVDALIAAAGPDEVNRQRAAAHEPETATGQNDNVHGAAPDETDF